jgi:hypothetical protein
LPSQLFEQSLIEVSRPVDGISRNTKVRTAGDSSEPRGHPRYSPLAFANFPPKPPFPRRAWGRGVGEGREGALCVRRQLFCGKEGLPSSRCMPAGGRVGLRGGRSITQLYPTMKFDVPISTRTHQCRDKLSLRL